MARSKMLGLLFVVGLLGAACGDGGGGTAVPELQTADSVLGEILVDGQGLTLYAFMPDERSDSVCYGDCEVRWPPLVGDVQAGVGTDPGLMGTTMRTDGKIQVTFNGWPLYYFEGDALPGDVNGQGLGDVWFAVSPAGNITGG